MMGYTGNNEIVKIQRDGRRNKVASQVKSPQEDGVLTVLELVKRVL